MGLQDIVSCGRFVKIAGVLFFVIGLNSALGLVARLVRLILLCEVGSLGSGGAGTSLLSIAIVILLLAFFAFVSVPGLTLLGMSFVVNIWIFASLFPLGFFFFVGWRVNYLVVMVSILLVHYTDINCGGGFLVAQVGFIVEGIFSFY
jgi:hypothetical protein